MKTLVSYIRESFNDSILKEYFAYANKLDSENKRLLTAPVLRASATIDLHNVKAVKQSFDTYNTVASIKEYFNHIVTNSLRQTSNGYISMATFNLFIIKMQKDDATVFGLVIPYYEWGATKLKELKLILPDNINEPTNYVMDDLITSCSKLSKLIKQGWSVTVFRYLGDGDNDLSDLYKLRKERKTNKQGVLDNSEEFLSWYKDNQVRKRLLKLIQNASKRADPDYKAMLDEAKEEINKLFKFIDTLNRATKAAGHDIDVKGSEDTSYILQQIDNYVMKATEMLNNPDFYTSASTVIKDHFIGYIDSIKSLIDDAYQSMKGTIEFDFRKNKV